MSFSQKNELRDTYDIIEEIGSGGGGIIYKAYHKRLQKYVVLKKIRSNVRDVINIRMETDILKNLHHSYLPQVLDFLEIDDDVYTVMDFVPGKSFAELIQQGQKFTHIQILKYTEQLCEALACLHEQKSPILHGDIKPANIMLKPDDNICLIDFNISGFLTDGNIVTMGYSAGYAAPEQCKAVEQLKNTLLSEKNVENDKTIILSENQKEKSERESLTVNNSNLHIDQRADVYSIGATVYHLATGIQPNSNAEDNRPICDLTDKYSYGFSAIIEKSMAREPDKRFKDAVAMLKAVKNIHKYDKKYKALLVKQEIIYIALICVLGVSVSMIFAGKQKMRQEKEKKYDVMIEQLKESRTGMQENFETLFQEACEYMPERLDAYYEKALYLEQQDLHEENIYFIQSNLLNNNTFDNQDFQGSIYYLLANSYFEMEDYQNAVIYYQAAIESDGQVSQYYGDYAIALVYCGEIDNAEEVLKQGREKGLESDYNLLVSAEIEAAKGRYKEAIEHFQGCLETSKNPATKLRAYILCDKVLRKQGITEKNLLQSVKLLMRAEAELDLSDQILILERLAQDYIDLSSSTGDMSYDQKALDVFVRIVQYGWDNYTTHINMAILYEKTGRYSEAEEELKLLTEQEPDNYIAYKRLAVLEIDIQNMKDNAKREYYQFLEYYNHTIELYEKTKMSGNDVEIQWLNQTYEQLVDGGWL